MRSRNSLLQVLFAVSTLTAACHRELLCPEDQVVCEGRCIAVNTDPANCGACGRVCAQGETCAAGSCRCPDGRGSCGGACVDLDSDPANCGSCGEACPAALLCTKPSDGTARCAEECAGPDQTDCERACVSLQSDPWNCGACGRTCGTGERCEAGACQADLYVACYFSNELRGATRDLQPSGVPLPVAAGPIGLTWLDGQLFVASAYYQGAETLARVDRDPPQPRTVSVWTSPATPDIQFLAAHGGYLYLSHTSLGTLLVLSPGGDVIEEHSFVGEGEPNPNPLGLAFEGERAYVALNARDEVAVLDVSQVGACATPGACIRELARVDVQPAASAGANARPARIAVVGDRAYVALWNLDEAWNPPAGSSGRLAVIDRSTNTLDATVGTDGVLDLGTSCLNPADVAPSDGTLWVSCGAFDRSTEPTTILGGAVVPVDLSKGVPEAGPALPAPEGAAPGDFAFCSDRRYVADHNSGRVFELDPATGAVRPVELELCPRSGGNAYVADIACGF